MVRAPVKVAVFGTGYAEEHVRGYQARDDVEVAVVCASRRSSAESFALEHGIAFATSSYEEALSFPGLTAVSIATPPATHPKIALAATNREFACVMREASRDRRATGGENA